MTFQPFKEEKWIDEVKSVDIEEINQLYLNENIRNIVIINSKMNWTKMNFILLIKFQRKVTDEGAI